MPDDPSLTWPTTTRDPQPGDRPPVWCTLGALLDQHRLTVAALEEAKKRFHESERAICHMVKLAPGERVLHNDREWSVTYVQGRALLASEPSGYWVGRSSITNACDVEVPKGLFGDREEGR